MENKHLKNLKEAFIEAFNDNLESILLFGSYISQEDFFDYDILIILKNKLSPIKDHLLAKKIKKSLDKSVTLDLQIIYIEEILSGDTFSLDAQGCYFVEILKNSIVLYGNNPFQNLGLSILNREVSLLNKVQNYVCRARQELTGHGRNSKDKNPEYHKKKITRIMYDILLLEFVDLIEKDTLKTFKKIHWNVLGEEEFKILANDRVLKLEVYLEIYEKLYTYILMCHGKYILHNNVKLQRLNLDGIVVEYLLNNLNNKAIILLDGLPSVPSKNDFVFNLYKLGYSVFYPRYRGTWESEGKFLEKSPTQEINFLIEKLYRGIELDFKNYQFQDIMIIASSFGGAIALSLDNNKISKKICFSPVYDFKEVVGIETLESFLKEQYPMAYRFDNRDWEKLLNNKLLRPNFNRSKTTFIFGGSNDSQIPVESIRAFCTKHNLKFNVVEGLGHISFSKIQSTLWRQLISIIS